MRGGTRSTEQRALRVFWFDYRSSNHSNHRNAVLSMVGTDDVNGNLDVAAAPTRLCKLILTMRAPTLQVVETIIPIENDGTNQKVQAYNAASPASRSFCSTSTRRFRKGASEPTTLISSYLHLKDAGDVVLGRAMFDAVCAVPH